MKAKRWLLIPLAYVVIVLGVLAGRLIVALAIPAIAVLAFLSLLCVILLVARNNLRRRRSS